MAGSGRTPLIAGNWKMNKGHGDAAELAKQLRSNLQNISGVEVVVCPPFPWLLPVGNEIEGSNIALGAQNVHWEAQGAYTGEVSPGMLLDAGCRFVIIGHSERRQYFGETDEMVARKVRAAIDAGLTPIICVGETWEQREAGETATLVTNQVTAAISGLSAEQVSKISIAYEPIWAIGTGRSSNGSDASEVARLIRRAVGQLTSAQAAASLRILYGGSVTPANISEFILEEDIDGALVGGASLKADSFSSIAEAALVTAAG